MTDPAHGSPPERGYVVFLQIEPGLWRLVGDVDHRPGLTQRAERAQAVRDTAAGTAASGVYAALHRDEWHVVRYG